MSNPNTTPTLDRQEAYHTIVAQQAGEQTLAETIYVEPFVLPEVKEPRMTDSRALEGSHSKWLGFDRNGEPKLDRQARLKQQEETQQAELRRQAVDVTGE
jgi:hypothetical protein